MKDSKPHNLEPSNIGPMSEPFKGTSDQNFAVDLTWNPKNNVHKMVQIMPCPNFLPTCIYLPRYRIHSFPRLFFEHLHLCFAAFPHLFFQQDLLYSPCSAKTNTYCSKARCPTQVPTFQGLPFDAQKSAFKVKLKTLPTSKSTSITCQPR